MVNLKKHIVKTYLRNKKCLNNIHYYILFPCDLTKDNTYNILNNDSIKLRKNIESFVKNNIDWDKVSKIGELKYSEEIKWGRNVIDYGEAV
mgnify:CR=1 FL=1